MPAPRPADHATPEDERAMQRALQLAREAADVGEAPIGAVIYETSTGQTLAEARNTREGDNDPAGHAELLAIRAAAKKIGDWRLNHCTLVVTLEPCVMCAGAIVNARVGRLVYGAADPKAGAVESLFTLCQDERLNHRLEPIAGLCARECGALLSDFFRARRDERKAARDQDVE